MATPILSGVVQFMRDGVPCRVEVQPHDEPIALRDGETARWLIGGLSLEAARRLREAVLHLLLRWCDGQPDWLESHVLKPPSHYGRGKCRGVVSIVGDEVTPYRSLLAASRATGIDRTILRRRLSDGRPDSAGQMWRDVKPK